MWGEFFLTLLVLLPFAQSPSPLPPTTTLWRSLVGLCPPQSSLGGEDVAVDGNADISQSCIQSLRTMPDSAFEATLGVSRSDIHAASGYLAWLGEREDAWTEETIGGRPDFHKARDLSNKPHAS